MGGDQNLKTMMETLLCVHYNIGFCQGTLGDLEKMREAYNMGLEISKLHLEEGHLLVGIIKKALQESYVSSVL